jgi:hypothetical protein
MSWTPKTTSNFPDKELIPASSHMARCYGLVDLGTHPRPDFKGKPKSPAQQIMIFFEFPKIMREFTEGKGLEPAVKSRKFTFVFGDNSHLTKCLKPWIGDPEKYDLGQIVGMPAQVKISHDTGTKDPSKTYDNIETVSELMEEMKPLVPAQINPSLVFNIDEHGFGSPEFAALSPRYEWVKKIIMESMEYKEYETNVAERNAATLKKSLPPADQTEVYADLPPFDEN